VVEAFSTDLADTAIIHIGRAVHTRDPFFLRVMHLVKASPETSPGESPPETRS
jgi:hypothetical protein